MKLKRIFTFALSTVMAMSAFGALSVNAAGTVMVETVIFDENFESMTADKWAAASADGEKWSYTTTTTVGTTLESYTGNETNGNVLKVPKGTELSLDLSKLGINADTVANSNYKVSFEVKQASLDLIYDNDTNTTSKCAVFKVMYNDKNQEMFKLFNGTATANGLKWFLAGDWISLCSDSTKATKNFWKLEYIWNTDTGKVTATGKIDGVNDVYYASANDYAAIGTQTGKQTWPVPTDSMSAGKIVFKALASDVYVDNIKIIKITEEEEEPVWEDKKIEYDFDDFDIDSDSAWSVPSNGGTATIDNGALKIVSDTENGQYKVRYTLPSAWKSGTYKLNFDFKFSHSVWDYGRVNVRLFNSLGAGMQIFGVQNDWIYDPSGAQEETGLYAISKDTWYRYEVDVNLDEDYYEAVFTNLSTNSSSSKKGKSLDISGELAYIEFMSNYPTKTLWIDNFVIESIENPVTVDKNSVTFVDGGGNVQSDWTDISPATSKIKVDFGMGMYSGHLNDENIYVLDSNGNKVAHIGTYAAGVYTMKFDDIFEAGKTYTLFVSGNIKNSTGLVSGSDYSVTFTAGNGGVTQAVGGLKSGDTYLTSIADVLSKTTVDAVLNYTNTTGVEKNLYMIVNFYSDGEMVKSNYFIVNKAANVYTEEIKQSVAVPQDLGVDCVKVMAWDGFDTMKSVADFVELK